MFRSLVFLTSVSDNHGDREVTKSVSANAPGKGDKEATPLDVGCMQNQLTMVRIAGRVVAHTIGIVAMAVHFHNPPSGTGKTQKRCWGCQRAMLVIALQLGT